MDPSLKINMFVAICRDLVIPEYLNLNGLCQMLNETPFLFRKQHRYIFDKVVGKFKGKLGTKCGVNGNMGSISVHFKYDNENGQIGHSYTNYNLLIFKKCVRISGGISDETQTEIHETISEEPIKEFCRCLMLALYYFTGKCITYSDDIEVVNINAVRRHEPIPHFFEFCTKLQPSPNYDRVYLPLFFETGNIATCSIYPMAGTNCGAKLFKGSVQYMGFKEIDTLHVFSEMIKQEVNSK